MANSRSRAALVAIATLMLSLPTIGCEYIQKYQMRKYSNSPTSPESPADDESRGKMTPVDPGRSL